MEKLNAVLIALRDMGFTITVNPDPYHYGRDITEMNIIYNNAYFGYVTLYDKNGPTFEMGFTE